MEAADQVAVAGLDDHPHPGRDGAERAEIGVVHVCVGEQDRVELRQLALGERGGDQPPRADLGQSPTQADPPLEHGIGEQPGPLEIEQHGRVTEPRYGQPIVRPRRRIGPVGRRRDRTLLPALEDRTPGVPSGERQACRNGKAHRDLSRTPNRSIFHRQSHLGTQAEK